MFMEANPSETQKVEAAPANSWKTISLIHPQRILYILALRIGP